MPRPGWDVISRDAPVPPTIPTDTGVLFAVGATEKGPEVPVLIRSLSSYEASFGVRTGGVDLYDAVDTFFREGGSKVYISAVPTTPDPARFVVTPDGASYPYPGVEAADVAELATTALSRDELNDLAAQAGVEDPASLPNKEAVVQAIEQAAEDAQAAAAPRALNGDLVTALDRFESALGPGQVIAPGSVDPAVQAALLEHAGTHNRVALLESPPDADAAALKAFVTPLTANAYARYGALFAPRGVVPGIAPLTTRFVGWSTAAAGIIARADARGLNPNVPAAGSNGQSIYAVALEARFSDADYEDLNDNGVNCAQYRWGRIQTYGYRSLIDPDVNPAWKSFGNARLNMAIVAQAGAVAERYVFSQIDGTGKRIAEFGGDLRAMLVPFYEAGALYGASAPEAFQVNVGPAVNTPETIAAGELHAVLMVRMSPFSEYVLIEIVKVATTEALASVAA